MYTFLPIIDAMNFIMVISESVRNKSLKFADETISKIYNVFKTFRDELPQ